MEKEKSIEIRLLILCLRVFLKTEKTVSLRLFLNDNEINWQLFKRLVTYHKLKIIVYKELLKVDIPQNIAAQIKIELVKQNTRIKKQIKQTFTILELLNKKENIKAIPFKGFVLSDLLYKNTGYRQSVDIDFAIESNDVKRIIPVLEKEGYKFLKKQEYESLGVKNYVKNNSDIVFLKKNNFSLEFHWRVNQTKIDFRNNSAIINTNNYLTKTISGNKVNILNSQEHLRQLYLHHIFSDSANKLYHWLELAVSFQKFEQEKTLKKIFKKYDYVRNDMILEIISKLFNLTIINFDKRKVSEHKVDKVLNDLLDSNMTNIQRSDFILKLDSIKRTLLFIEPLKIKVFFVLKRLYAFMKPWGTDYDYVKLPKFLFFMYFFVRVYRVFLQSFNLITSKK